MGSSVSDYDALAKPVENRIFFAGEHTHRHHPATVTGAYLRYHFISFLYFFINKK